MARRQLECRNDNARRIKGVALQAFTKPEHPLDQPTAFGESLCVLTLPDVRVALWIELEIEPALLLENSRKPRIVAPVRLYQLRAAGSTFVTR